MTFRILVTGSSTWTDEKRLGEELHAAASAALRAGHHDVLFVHGACPAGADKMTERWCRRNGFPTERHPADWQTRGRAAGPLRNAEMVDLGANRCIAFLMPCTRDSCGRPEDHYSHGADGTANLAEKAGIPTRRVPYIPAPAAVTPENLETHFGVFVSTPVFTCLLLFDQQGGACIEAPPYLQRYVGWAATAIRQDLRQRHGHKLYACAVPATTRALPQPATEVTS